jgi:hypothetical protein
MSSPSRNDLSIDIPPDNQSDYLRIFVNYANLRLVTTQSDKPLFNIKIQTIHLFSLFSVRYS